MSIALLVHAHQQAWVQLQGARDATSHRQQQGKLASTWLQLEQPSSHSSAWPQHQSQMGTAITPIAVRGGHIIRGPTAMPDLSRR